MTRPPVRRVCEPPSPEDSERVLIDRLWPRGLSKADARIDDWPKDVTSSPELRRWFHGPDGSWPEFLSRYLAELSAPGPAAEALERLRERAGASPLTLLTAARDPEHSHAAVLADELAS
jgi:uncharacterized protein YeaO (DUF488 family)